MIAARLSPGAISNRNALRFLNIGYCVHAQFPFDNCRLTDLRLMLAGQNNFAEGWEKKAVTRLSAGITL